VGALGSRLIQLDEQGRRIASIRLGTRETVIGRDPEQADLVVEDSMRVSSRHAAVRAVGDGFELVDLGSTNGTTLNGDAIQRVRLEDGDSIRLGDDVELVFEVGGGNGRVVAALVALLLAVGAGAWLWWSRTPGPEEVVMAKATQLASEGITASEAGNPEMAKERFQSAAALMFRAGLLDDVERDVIMRTAMERIGTRLGPQADLWLTFKTTMQALAKKREEDALRVDEAARRSGVPGITLTDTPSCRLDAVDAKAYEPCLRSWVRKVLGDLRQQPKEELPEDFISLIAERQCVEHGFFESSLARGKPVVPMMCEELQKRYLPPKIHYLSLIESGYRTGALSSAAAFGPWQFIPETGRRYGLKIGPGVDERSDFRKSTAAAAEYLNDLLMDFGGDSLLLALAGYNRGEQGIRNALRQLEDPFSDRSYWKLVETINARTGKPLLPPETACYVSRFLAAATAGEGGLPDPAVVAAFLRRPCSQQTCVGGPTSASQATASSP